MVFRMPGFALGPSFLTMGAITFSPYKQKAAKDLSATADTSPIHKTSKAAKTGVPQDVSISAHIEK